VAAKTIICDGRLHAQALVAAGLEN
jgi:hypothetical protein